MASTTSPERQPPASKKTAPAGQWRTPGRGLPLPPLNTRSRASRWCRCRDAFQEAEEGWAAQAEGAPLGLLLPAAQRRPPAQAQHNNVCQDGGCRSRAQEPVKWDGPWQLRSGPRRRLSVDRPRVSLDTTQMQEHAGCRRTTLALALAARTRSFPVWRGGWYWPTARWCSACGSSA